MTRKKEYLEDDWKLENAWEVKFGNNHKCSKDMEKLQKKCVAYVERLKHSLISVSQSVVGIGNQVTFNEDDNIILNKFSK